MADFHDELIEDILQRLPVKSLLRFRCVSKTWSSLIDNNTFVKQHLNHSIKTKNNKLTIVFDNYSDIIYSLGLNPLADQALELAQPIKNPKAASAKVVGSCNGLLCLFYESLNDLVVIWNPATRKHLMLPYINTIKTPFDYPFFDNPLQRECKLFVHGFGYDSVSGDYKVVLLVHFFLDDHYITESYVYCLRSGSWRVIYDVPDCNMDDVQQPNVLTRGAVHWMAIKHESVSSDDYKIVAFDLATVKYRLVTLPEYHVDDLVSSFLGSELGGCLSIVCDHFMVDVYDVWVMKDYGVTESWTKLFTISSSDNIPIEHLIPLGYSVIGDEVLLVLDSEMFFWYNLETMTVKFVDVSGILSSFRHVIFLESLVCLGEKAQHDKRLVGEKKPEEEHEEEASSWRSRQVDQGGESKKKREPCKAFRMILLLS